MTSPEKFELYSEDVITNRINQLLLLFPEIHSEGGKIDIERLKLALGEIVDIGKERYGLLWPGKAECFKTIQMPSMGTLLPCPTQSVDFNETENLIVEGDNLEVLKLLQKSYLGKVKMIYIDPPFNTGNDFVYPDDFSESLQTYLEYTGQVDSKGKKFGTNTEADGRFHSKWLNMMYPRLYLARNLLRDDGVIFISIDDHEADNLRKLCNEVFGEQNFVAQFVWNTEGHTDNQFDVKVNHEYVVLYAKNGLEATLGHVVDPNTRKESNLWKGFAENSITKNGPGNPPSEVELPSGFPCNANALDLTPTDIKQAFYDDLAKKGYITREMTDQHDLTYPIRRDRMIIRNGHLVDPCRVFSGWANVNKLRKFISAACEPIIDEVGDALSFFLSERGVIYYRRERKRARNILSVIRNVGTTERMRSELESMGIPFQYPKPKELLSYLIQIGLERDGLILDFFAGSGTTAQAVLELNKEDGGNRQFILVQLPEPTERDDYPTIADICKERVRRVINKLNEEYKGKLDLTDKNKEDRGFRVLKLAESNFKPWNADGAQDEKALEKQLEMHIDHILEARTADDILYELLLKSGFTLTTPVEKITLAGKLVYSVAGGALFICLDKNLTLELIRAAAEKKPERVVCLDAGFAGNDQLKTNAVQIFKTKGVNKFQTV